MASPMASPTLPAGRGPTMLPEETGEELNRLSRRIKLFRRRGMLGGDKGRRLQVHRAGDLDELRQAYRLVHDVYVHRGYIQAQPGDLRLRVYEALPEMATFIATDGGKIVGVMSVLPDTPALGLPSDRAFRAELGQLRAEGRRLGETTNLAIHWDYRNTNVFLELSRCCTAYAERIGLDDLFIAISPGHGQFFQDILQFDPMGELRDCGQGVVDLVEGKRLDLHRFESRLRAVDRRLGDQAFVHDWFFGSNTHRAPANHGNNPSHPLSMEGLRRLFSPLLESVSHSEQQLREWHEHWNPAALAGIFSGVTPAE